MRIIIINAILITVLITVFTKYGYSQSSKVLVGAFIEYEDFATSTVEDVPCEFFKAAFAGTIKHIDIKDTLELKQIASFANRFKAAKPKSIDVRVLVTFCYKGVKEQYCMDRWGLFVNKKTGKYYSNKLLTDFVLKRCQ
ncbi:hypothetical protein J2T02_005719 [Chitinophaga terrae (ex Kim and Jung 2007)]|uniref:hypothetical protein n=1 Tax=Chitinophaga terrae (ex Kim and Jung 2007) TaxID=408074 RepID=UPI0027814BDF|nr:hypothetical protein [Chitinophaga terrae (ex Kim and Jung 2007)]MDQ0110566.1 hypothetical protein [Chitinophaga terrae (ex Kim and Jung 2007)]